MIAALVLASVVAAGDPEAAVSVRVDATAGVELRRLRPGPWRVPATGAGAFALEPRVRVGDWHVGVAVLYRSSVRATLVERSPGVTRPVRVDTFEGALRAERLWTRGLWAFEFGASVWGGRWRLAAPRPGRLSGETTGMLRLGAPLRVRRGRLKATFDVGGGVALGSDRVGPLWGVRADVRFQVVGPLIVIARAFHDGWTVQGSAETGVALTAGLGIEVPQFSRRISRDKKPLPEPNVPSERSDAENRPSAPALAGPTLDGHHVDLKALKGSVVVVDFWASWCGPCRDAMPRLEAQRQEWAGQDVVVLGVSMDEEPEEARAFMREAGVGFESVHDASGAWAEAWAPPKMPTTYVIDRQGRVAHVHAGVQDGDDARLAREVASLLNEKP